MNCKKLKCDYNQTTQIKANKFCLNSVQKLHHNKLNKQNLQTKI